MKVRIKFSKKGAVKFIGHLDMMRYFQKAVRRAEIDIAYSAGFSPHQIMSFAAPLSVGHTSEGEYFDIEVNSLIDTDDIKKRLNQTMAEGIEILYAAVLDDKDGNAMASVAAASYLVSFRENVMLPAHWKQRLLEFYSRETIPVTKKSKRGEREIDLKAGIYELAVKGESVYMLINASSGDNIKPALVLETFFREIKEELPEFSLLIHRLDTLKNVGTKEAPVFVPLICENDPLIN